MKRAENSPASDRFVISYMIIINKTPEKPYFCNQEPSNRCQRGKNWCQKHTNISNINRNGQFVECPIDDSRGGHESRIDGSSNAPAKGVPGFAIEPVPEAIKSFTGEVLCGPVIEPGVELMNDAFVSDDL